MSRATRFHKDLAGLLAQYAKLLKPNLTYSCIQVCRDLPSTLHIDPRNVGPSGLVTFGDYVGGNFWIWDDKNGNIKMEVNNPIRNRPEIPVGGTLNGTLHDTKEDMAIFDATNPHCAQPFIGTR